MSVLKVSITTGRPDSYLTQNFETVGGPRSMLERLKQYVERIASGNELYEASTNTPPSVRFVVQGNQVQASGTLTFVSAVATNTFSINGVTFTGIASGATGNQFNIGADDTATAANAAAVINASVTALISGYVTATSALGVVTIKSTDYGIAGNQTTLAGGTNITASAARLTGGIQDPSALTISL